MIPRSRLIDCLAARHVLQLEDVRMGWIRPWELGIDVFPDSPSRSPWTGYRDFVYRARRPHNDSVGLHSETGYEQVSSYATDGNAMLWILELLELRGVWVHSIRSTRTNQPAVWVNLAMCPDGESIKTIGGGSAKKLPEAIALASLDLYGVDVAKALRELETEIADSQ